MDGITEGGTFSVSKWSLNPWEGRSKMLVVFANVRPCSSTARARTKPHNSPKGEMMGRPPKSTDWKVLSGTKASRINRNEPKPERGTPDAPGWFTDAQREQWDHLIECMLGLGLLSKNEQGALVRLACARAGHAEAAQRLATEGQTLVDDKGRRYRNPSVSIAKDLSAECSKIETDIGLAPVARSRVSAVAQETKRDAKAEKARRMFGK